MILVVVNYCYLLFCPVLPTEYNPPLLIDSNAPKSIQVPFQLLKSITGWYLKILNNSRLIDHAQLTSCPLLYISRQATNP